MVMVGALALGATACGGDDDDDDASSSEADSGDDDSGDDDDGGFTDDDSGDDDSGDDDDDAVTEEDLDDLEDAANLFTSEECAAAVTAMIGAAAAAGTAFTGSDSEIDDSLGLLEEYADNAPEEIRDDLQTVYEGYAEFVEALEESGFDPESGEVPDADALAALEDASSSLDNEEFTEASERVSTWFETECATE